MSRRHLNILGYDGEIIDVKQYCKEERELFYDELASIINLSSIWNESFEEDKTQFFKIKNNKINILTENSNDSIAPLDFLAPKHTLPPDHIEKNINEVVVKFYKILLVLLQEFQHEFLIYYASKQDINIGDDKLENQRVFLSMIIENCSQLRENQILPPLYMCSGPKGYLTSNDKKLIQNKEQQSRYLSSAKTAGNFLSLLLQVLNDRMDELSGKRRRSALDNFVSKQAGNPMEKKTDKNPEDICRELNELIDPDDDRLCLNLQNRYIEHYFMQLSLKNNKGEQMLTKEEVLSFLRSNFIGFEPKCERVILDPKGVTKEQLRLLIRNFQNEAVEMLKMQPLPFRNLLLNFKKFKNDSEEAIKSHYSVVGESPQQNLKAIPYKRLN